MLTKSQERTGNLYHQCGIVGKIFHLSTDVKSRLDSCDTRDDLTGAACSKARIQARHP